MRPTLVRSLAILVIFISIFVTRTARVTAACSSGIVTSPQGNFESYDPSTSADGRYTAFWSAANDLVPGDTNNRYDVFVVDRQTCAIDRVSLSTVGVAGNSDSQFPAISGDGRYVAFMSYATNLVPLDTNAGPDIFVRDRTTNTTVRASVSTAGAQATGTSGSVRPGISANGQFVAFLSFSPNLVAGDTNGHSDVFVRDLVNDTTTRVSVATGGAEGTDGNTNYNKPVLSADGRYVAFASSLLGLVPGDTNGAQDIFRHDRQTGTTIRVSVSSAGAQSENAVDAAGPVISADGRYIAFDSYAANLVAGDTNALYDVFVRDVDTSTTSRVSLINQGGQPLAFPWANSTGPAISGDGRYVAFSSGAADLVAGDSNGWNDVFLHDRTTGITRRVSTSFDGIQGDFHAQFVDISSDGQFVAFASSASMLVPNDTNFTDDVFITDWKLVSAPPDVNLIRNGGFGTSTTNWLQFATPDMSYIVSGVVANVFQFYRVTPPAGTTNQAVAFQPTTAQLLPGAPIVASFALGNSMNLRRRVSVLIHDADFSDLRVCTLWLAPNAPMQTYTMRTHTTKAWANATIAFYAASAGSDGGFYRVDNVSLMYSPAEANDRTECVDPTTPAPPGGAAGPNLIANGDFTGGMASWGTFGQIVSQVAGGMFEFYRPPGTPAGVVLQGTGQAMTSGQILTATFDLGNSSIVRKRVTVLLHDADFSDLVACTFWLPPSSPLGTFVIRAYATKAWTNAMVSVYPATVGPDPWIRLDNVMLQRTPATAIVGVECYEPGATPPAPYAGFSGGFAIGSPGSSAFADASADRRSLGGGGQPRGSLRNPFDDRLSIDTRLRYWLPPSDTGFEIQVSADGETWQTIAVLEPNGHWQLVTLDPSEFSELVMYVRVKSL